MHEDEWLPLTQWTLQRSRGRRGRDPTTHPFLDPPIWCPYRWCWRHFTSPCITSHHIHINISHPSDGRPHSSVHALDMCQVPIDEPGNFASLKTITTMISLYMWWLSTHAWKSFGAQSLWCKLIASVIGF